MARSKWQRGKAPARPQREQEAEETQQQQQQQQQQSGKRSRKQKKARSLATGELFAGIKFYLARTLSVDRRAELRELITQNGGVVQAKMDIECTEIVERHQLNPDKNWVAADFIEDSLRDGMLQDIVQYIAPTQTDRATCEALWAMRKSKQQRVPFTTEDQAKMLQYLKDKHPNYYGKPTIPERIWKIAAANDLLPGRSHQSMHEHSRKKLVKLTKKERDAILQRAALNATDEVTDANVGSTSRVSEEANASEDDGEATESEREMEERATKRLKRSASDDAPHHPRSSEDESDPEQQQQQQQQEDHEQPPTPAEDAEQAKGSGEVFKSYWERTAADPVERRELERYFERPPAPVDEPEPSAPFSAAASSYRTPQRSRRLSNESRTPTPQDDRRARRSSTEQSSTPRTPAQAAQEQLLSVLEEMIGQRMTPPRRTSLDRLLPISQANEAEADEVLARLVLETGQDINTVCSAMYWVSGDAKAAKEFLLGYLPVEMWSPAEDRLLVDYMSDRVTENELAGARRQGKFDGMRVKRSVRDILRRIQFLL